MYQLEAFRNRTTVKEYIRDYAEGEGFLEFCEKRIGFGQIWSCPLYDFNPTSFGKKYKYLYLFGKRVIFDPEVNHDKVWKKSKAVDKELERAKKKEREKYISEVCLMEKNVLTEQIQALERKYPGSVSLPAGSCHVCSRCNRLEEAGCRYSDEIRFFIESLGGSIGGTAGELLGIELQWMKHQPPGYYTLIEGLFSDNPRVVL
jgi:predicted metal-binding protein